jgi:hypothetical protein
MSSLRPFKIGWDYNTNLAGATDGVIMSSPPRGTSVCIEAVWIYVLGGGSDIMLGVKVPGIGTIPVFYTTTTAGQENYPFRGPIILEEVAAGPTELVLTNANGVATEIVATAEWVKR